MLGAVPLLCYSPRKSMMQWLSAAAVALVCAGCSDALGGDDAGTGGSGTSAFDLGNPCTASGDCSSVVCLPVGSNTEGVTGLCSSGCSSSADCGSSGVCLQDPSGMFADACFRRCASSGDCVGLPCVWLAQAGSGICLPIATNICLAGGSTSCVNCAANGCCNEYTFCLADTTCGKDLAACSSGACLTNLVSSGDETEATLGACMATNCASVCP
jgi:hypothetical protein